MFGNTEASEQNRSSNKAQGGKKANAITFTVTGPNDRRRRATYDLQAEGKQQSPPCRLMFIRHDECLETQRLLNKTVLLTRHKVERQQKQLPTLITNPNDR